MLANTEDRRRRDEMVGWHHPTKDEMVGWHHQLNRHEFEQTPGDSEVHGSLICCRL